MWPLAKLRIGSDSAGAPRKMTIVDQDDGSFGACRHETNTQPHAVRFPAKHQIGSVAQAMLRKNVKAARGEGRHVQIRGFDLKDLG